MWRCRDFTPPTAVSSAVSSFVTLVIQMKRTLPVAVCLVLLSAFSSILADDALADDGVERTQAEQIARWVRDLGAEQFSARQRAARELILVGPPTKNALIAALKDSDAEVRRRAGELLLDVLDADFHVRLERFAVDEPTSKDDHGLPLWDRFREIVGDDRGARRLFVEMQRVESVLLETARDAPDRLSDALAMRTSIVTRTAQRDRSGNSSSKIPVPSVVAFLLLGADSESLVAGQARKQVYDGSYLYYSNFREAINSGPYSKPLHLLLAKWLARGSGSAQAGRDLWLSLYYKLPEGLPLATRIISKEKHPARTRQIALLVVAEFGDKEHVEVVEPLLEDTHSQRESTREGETPLEVRDVALGTLIALTGQRLADYGYQTSSVRRSYAMGRLDRYRFASPQRRVTALKKWQAWRAIQKAGR